MFVVRGVCWPRIASIRPTPFDRLNRIKNRTLLSDFGTTRCLTSEAVVEDVINDRTSTNGLQNRSKRAFGKLIFQQEYINVLEEAGISSLTEIQEKAIPVIREHHNVLLASHTGSGKTFAYLLPIIERLKEAEEQDSSPVRPKRPKAVVLGPTRELTDQILLVAKSISHHVKFCSMGLNAGIRMRTQKRNLALHQDLVVATPSKLMEHLSLGNVFLGDVQILVLDEADTLFDHTFIPEIEKIIQILQKRTQNCQFVLVGATVPKKIKSKIRNLIPDVKMVETSTLHKGVRGSSHSFSTLKPGEDKLKRVQDLVSSLQTKRQKTMIFCNTLNSCRCVEHTLQESGLSTLCYHGEIPKTDRKSIIDRFSNFETEGHVLVCTDVAARGLDIPGGVEQIINFDFPLNPVDYLHRSGRTARAGAHGKILSLVGGKDRVLADRIKWAVNHDLPLDELTSRKHILPPSQRQNRKESIKKQGIVKKVSFKGLRGPKRVEALQEIAKVNSEKRRIEIKQKWIGRGSSKSYNKRSISKKQSKHKS